MINLFLGYAYGMERQAISQYILIFLLSFGAAYVVVTGTLEYFKKQSTAQSPTTALYTATAGSSKNASEEVAQEMNDQATLDAYARHLVSLNDPQVGCGCPSCCAAS